MKNILFVASESVPFIKTGGLADVVGSLPKSFNKEEYDCRVILPKYMCMKWEYVSQLEYMTNFYMNLNWRSQYVGIFRLVYEGITFYFIDNEYYFSGDKPYTGDTKYDIERFAFFQELHFQHCQLLALDQTLFIATTGRQDLYLFILMTVSSREIFTEALRV